MFLSKSKTIENCMESAIPGRDPSIVRKLYLSGSTNQKTFQHDNSLPSLPVPELRETIVKYLKSVEPFGSPEQYAKTKLVAEKFEKGVGTILQEKLKAKARVQKNWLSEWWLKYAYLQFREPLAPCTNMSGPHSLNFSVWKPNEKTALEQTSLAIWTVLDFYSNLRAEYVKPHISRRGERFSMDQLRCIFNTTRIPMEREDKLNNYFKTKSEGPCPQHMIVFCFGHIWYMNPWHSEDESFSPPELEEQFKYIQTSSEALGEGQGIGTLTFDKRELWAKNRRWLSSLSPKNEENLHLIDSAVMVYTLDENTPRDVDEVCRMGLCGNPRSRWADKSYGGVTFKNGYHAVTNDHTPYDAMMSVLVGHYQNGIVADEFGGSWSGPKHTRVTTMPRRLVFVVDNLIQTSIGRIKTMNESLRKSIGVIFRNFDGFGKLWLKENKIHPDAFVQCSLQLAYYQTHKKFAPTYETATTRQFHKGRTETVRSCTLEMIKFVKSMTSAAASAEEKKSSLLKALNQHMQLLTECQSGQGIDRHLMGLSIIASENGMATPELFTDPLFALSGGGGNFVLSTSTTGFNDVLGGVAAMVKDGYGIFYTIQPDRIRFYLTNYVNSETNLNNLSQSLTLALVSMQELFTMQSKL